MLVDEGVEVGLLGKQIQVIHYVRNVLGIVGCGYLRATHFVLVLNLLRLV